MTVLEATSLGAFGAEVDGFDCRRPVDAATREAILAALFKHQFLVFRDQSLSKQEQVDFSAAFGPLEQHVNKGNHGYDIPYFHMVTNIGEDGRPLPPAPADKVYNGTSTWHTDKSYMPNPSLATLLHAVEVPTAGGETLFANLYAAYEALDSDRQQALDGRRAVHSWQQSLVNSRSRAATDEEIALAPPVVHPLIRTHPGTGRKALYIGLHASHIDDMPEEDGRALLFELLDFATQARFVAAHRWRVGDLVMWDNASLLHRGADYDRQSQRRVLHRTVIRGSVPF
ncbi:MAG: TauD/TfdA dioxygenase family protein [Alphaproteobacteria bacterium]